MRLCSNPARLEIRHRPLACLFATVIRRQPVERDQFLPCRFVKRPHVALFPASANCAQHRRLLSRRLPLARRATHPRYVPRVARDLPKFRNTPTPFSLPVPAYFKDEVEMRYQLCSLCSRHEQRSCRRRRSQGRLVLVAAWQHPWRLPSTPCDSARDRSAASRWNADTRSRFQDMQLSASGDPYSALRAAVHPD